MLEFKSWKHSLSCPIFFAMEFSLPALLDQIVPIRTGGKYEIHVSRLPQTVLASLDVDEVSTPARAAFKAIENCASVPPMFGVLVKCASAESSKFIVLNALPYDCNKGLFSTHMTPPRTLGFKPVRKR